MHLLRLILHWLYPFHVPLELESDEIKRRMKALREQA